MEQGTDRAAERTLERVVVEAPAGESPDFAPFEALVRHEEGDAMLLTGTGGDWLPYLVQGDRLLVVREEDEGSSSVAAVRVVHTMDDRSDTVRVEPAGEGRRSSRRAERTPVDGLVTIGWDGAGDAQGRLVDVSLTGLQIVVAGAAPETGAHVRVAGEVVEIDGPPVGWQLSGHVAWAVQLDGQAAVGVIADPGQRRPIVRLVRWARVHQLKSQIDA